MSENNRRAARGEPDRFLRDVVLPYVGNDCLEWPFTRPGGKYGTIRCGAQKRYVHRIVCAAVHGPAPSPRHHAAHKCGGGSNGCVNPAHLEWKTPKSNNADKQIHGTLANGERNGSAKLTLEQAMSIRGRRVSQKQAASDWGLSKTQYYAIAKGKSWSHINAV